MKISAFTLASSVMILATTVPSALAQQQPNPNGDRLIQPSDELPQPLDDDEIFITPATPAEDTPADDIT
ncbi:MAG: hypothetical protein HC799_13205, partial [Limnothrix sp. RL_2_0]|nr:hypothetical protein [Limnothrix sp. RL_2_0]